MRPRLPQNWLGSARSCRRRGLTSSATPITWDRRGVHGKTAFLGKVGAQVLVDDDFLTGREAEQSGCKFEHHRLGTGTAALRGHHQEFTR